MSANHGRVTILMYVPYDDIIWGITCYSEYSSEIISFWENYTSDE